MAKFAKKRAFGTGQNIIPFAVGEIVSVILTGYAYAMTKAGRDIAGVRTLFGQLPSEPTEEELVQFEETARSKGYEQYFWQPAVAEVNGTTILLADAGFTTEAKDFIVEERQVDGYATPLKQLVPVAKTANKQKQPEKVM